MIIASTKEKFSVFIFVLMETRKRRGYKVGSKKRVICSFYICVTQWSILLPQLFIHLLIHTTRTHTAWSPRTEYSLNMVVFKKHGGHSRNRVLTSWRKIAGFLNFERYIYIHIYTLYVTINKTLEHLYNRGKYLGFLANTSTKYIPMTYQRYCVTIF